MYKQNFIKVHKILSILLLCFILFVMMVLRYTFGIGTWRGKFFETYSKKAYQGYKRFITDLPSDAEDFRFQYCCYGVGAYSYAGFTLKKPQYDIFINSLSDTSNKDFVGKKVSETLNYYNDYGYYIGFPKRQCRYVTHDNIMNYTIVYYDSFGVAESYKDTVITNPNTGRIVLIHFGSD